MDPALPHVPEAPGFPAVPVVPDSLCAISGGFRRVSNKKLLK